MCVEDDKRNKVNVGPIITVTVSCRSSAGNLGTLLNSISMQLKVIPKRQHRRFQIDEFVKIQVIREQAKMAGLYMYKESRYHLFERKSDLPTD